MKKTKKALVLDQSTEKIDNQDKELQEYDQDVLDYILGGSEPLHPEHTV